MKFSVARGMAGFAPHVDTAQTDLEVGATKEELRNLRDSIEEAL